jgi:outer membrane protein
MWEYFKILLNQGITPRRRGVATLHHSLAVGPIGLPSYGRHGSTSLMQTRVNHSRYSCGIQIFGSLMLLLLLFTSTLSAQAELPDRLSLDQAISIGLINNFNIKIRKQAEKIAENNNNRGTAGYYPIITVGVDQNNIISNTNLTFLSGDELIVRGAVATTAAANFAVQWELFDGYRRGATLRKLGNEVQLTKAYTRAEAEMTVADIIKAYISLTLQTKLIGFTKENLEISRARRDLAIAKERIGSASGSSVLQARLDFNNDSLTYFNQMLQRDILQFQLLQLLQINSDSPFEVDTSEVRLLQQSYEMLRQQVLQQNTELLTARFLIGTAEEEIREAKSAQYPGVFINSGSNFNFSRNPANFVIQNIALAPYLGVTAAYTLYDGNNIKRNISNAKIQAETRRLEYENLQIRNAIQLNNLIAQHQSFDQQANILKDNIQISNENLGIAIQQYRLGAITDVEFREIQLKYIQSNFEVLQNQLQKALLEADILRITGNLIID